MAGFRTTILCGVLLSTWGCESPDLAPRSAGSQDGAAPSAWSEPRRPKRDGAAPSAWSEPRRPKRTYYLAYKADRCLVYWVDGQQQSVTRTEPCPRELQAGERVRLAGRVCIRESDNHAREGPMRCPQPLVEAEAHDRLDAGDKRLPPAGSAVPR
jgi:hypothetical protein